LKNLKQKAQMRLPSNEISKQVLGFKDGGKFAKR
jgi:hypothetical protein